MMTLPTTPALLTVGLVQAAFSTDLTANVAKMIRLVREAAAQGAQVVLLPELFQGPYFCQVEDEAFFAQAFPVAEHPAVTPFLALARELQVVLPVSFFEREGPHYYNSLAMIDATGEMLGVYRKSHIPDGPGYEEKFYFRPGNTGFRVWDTVFGRLGVGICWDQWFPECARAMCLQGAEVLFYPTAIGSEPHEPDLDTRRYWQRAMQGHAISNVTPIVAANRIGDENGQVFYGHSFIANGFGELVQELGDQTEGVAVTTLDLAYWRQKRAAFGFFRDRRPELYQDLTAL